MSEIIELTARLNEILLNGKWVTGTNIKKEISDLDWKKATQNINSLNSIAQLTFHIDYYIAGVLQVFEGGKLEIKDKYSFDLKPIKSQKDWENLVEIFCSDSEKFIQTVQNLTETDLEKIFADEKYGTFRRNINVIIEHSYYHLGQIMLIKKLMK